MTKLPREILIKRLRTEFASCKRSLKHNIKLSRGRFDTFPIIVKVQLVDSPGPVGLKSPRELEYSDTHTFIMKITENYPYQKPIVKWQTPIFHPNIQVPEDGGDVCTKLLDDWGFDSSLVSFIKGMETLLLQPNPKDPWGTDSSTRAAEYFNKYKPRKIKRSKKPPRIIVPGSEEHAAREKPKLVRADDRTTAELPPPLYYRMHRWNFEVPSFQLYISENGLEKIFKHALRTARTAEETTAAEATGFLIGTVNRWDGTSYPLVRDAIASRGETKGEVRFSRASFGNLLEDLNDIDYNYLIVGWYHSAPNDEAELVRKDIETHSRMFTKPFHRILKIDPVNQQMKVYRVADDAFEECPLAIYSEHLFGKMETEKYKMHKRRPGERVRAEEREAVVTMRPVEEAPAVAATTTAAVSGATAATEPIGAEGVAETEPKTGVEPELEPELEPEAVVEELPVVEAAPEAGAAEPPSELKPVPAKEAAEEEVEIETTEAVAVETSPEAPGPVPAPVSVSVSGPELAPVEVAEEEPGLPPPPEVEGAEPPPPPPEEKKEKEEEEEVVEEEIPAPPPEAAPEPSPPVEAPVAKTALVGVAMKRSPLTWRRSSRSAERAAPSEGWRRSSVERGRKGAEERQKKPTREKEKPSPATRFRRPGMDSIVSKKCPKCGFPVEDGWVLCPKCKGSLLS